VKEAAEAERARVASLLAAGMTIRNIAEETGLAKSTVHRLKQEIERGAAPGVAATAADGLVPCPSA
jgi:uncharacterized protein YerC